jgi:hypothetical protein
VVARRTRRARRIREGHFFGLTALPAFFSPIVLPMNTGWISLIVRILECFGFLVILGRKRSVLSGGSTGASCLVWNKDHAKSRRLGPQVLDFACLVFGFVELHAYVDILGSILEHPVDEHS